MGLNLGHAALREDISAEVQRLATIKEAARAAAKMVGAQGAAPGGKPPQGSLGAHEAPPPAQDGQGLPQAVQACARTALPRSARARPMACPQLGKLGHSLRPGGLVPLQWLPQRRRKRRWRRRRSQRRKRREKRRRCEVVVVSECDSLVPIRGLDDKYTSWPRLYLAAIQGSLHV